MTALNTNPGEGLSYDNNKVINEETGPRELQYEFKYNFITIPWDDRSNRSKIGIILLLTSIFVMMLALVINSILLHYSGPSKENRTFEINCNVVKVEDYRFVARIYSVESQELLCVGAVVSPSSVLANYICVKSGQISLRLGSASEPRCRKLFEVELAEKIGHDGVVVQNLVLLTTYDNILECASVIPIETTLLRIDRRKSTFIIGRPIYNRLTRAKSLTRRPVAILDKKACVGAEVKQFLNMNSTICVQDLSRCPVRAGDLLIHEGQLIGLASTSNNKVVQGKLVLFADLSLVAEDLKQIDAQIKLLRSNSLRKLKYVIKDKH